METGKFNSDFSLSKMGIKGLKSVHYNLNEASLMQHAVVRQEGKLGVGGALLVETGKHTGRSPKDKYIVVDDNTEDIVWWEKNGRMTPPNFQRLHKDILSHMNGKDYFVQDLYACANQDYKLNVRLITEFAWHSLFIRHLLRKPEADELNSFSPEFTIINCPSFKPLATKYEIEVIP